MNRLFMSKRTFLNIFEHLKLGGDESNLLIRGTKDSYKCQVTQIGTLK